MDEELKDLESKSIFIIREAHARFKNPALLWSMGKDSTTLLWLCRKAFYGEMPFKVLHIDTGFKFKEMYEFRDRLAAEWKLNLIVARNKGATATPQTGKLECCNQRKTDALKQAVEENGLDALLVGIRRDEHAIRGMERYFSPRDRDFKWHMMREKAVGAPGDSPFVSEQDSEMSGWGVYATDFGPATNHVRVHPLLHWTELEIWRYVKAEGIPVVSLYFAKGAKRYRSIGCECCCQPVDSSADSIDKIISELETTLVKERSGRAQDKEDDYAMQKLRSLGYM